MFIKNTIFGIAIFTVILTSCVKSDTPANCTYEDVRGVWVFHEGPRGNDKSINCSAKSKDILKCTV